jgi:acyl-coenzyme A synthetase/AMP-(fatty) acid ligase
LSRLNDVRRGRAGAGEIGWQVPKRIFFVSEIPVNERGKVNRRELAGKFAS